MRHSSGGKSTLAFDMYPDSTVFVSQPQCLQLLTRIPRRPSVRKVRQHVAQIPWKIHHMPAREFESRRVIERGE